MPFVLKVHDKSIKIRVEEEIDDEISQVTTAAPDLNDVGLTLTLDG